MTPQQRTPLLKGQVCWSQWYLYTQCQPFYFPFFRRMMIEKIAAHICEFTPRLHSNTRATYQYCAMPVIQYPQLEDELFCNIYYLRHLCDTVKFPGWEIREPVWESDYDHNNYCGCGFNVSVNV